MTDKKYYIFDKNGSSYKIYRDPHEPDNLFFERGWYIVNKIKNNDNFDEVVNLSRLWINVKYRNCVYANELMEKIKK